MANRSKIAAETSAKDSLIKFGAAFQLIFTVLISSAQSAAVMTCSADDNNAYLNIYGTVGGGHYSGESGVSLEQGEITIKKSRSYEFGYGFDKSHNLKMNDLRQSWLDQRELKILIAYEQPEQSKIEYVSVSLKALMTGQNEDPQVYEGSYEVTIHPRKEDDKNTEKLVGKVSCEIGY